VLLFDIVVLMEGIRGRRVLVLGLLFGFWCLRHWGLLVCSRISLFDGSSGWSGSWSGFMAGFWLDWLGDFARL